MRGTAQVVHKCHFDVVIKKWLLIIKEKLRRFFASAADAFSFFRR